MAIASLVPSVHPSLVRNTSKLLCSLNNELRHSKVFILRLCTVKITAIDFFTII